MKSELPPRMKSELPPRMKSKLPPRMKSKRLKSKSSESFTDDDRYATNDRDRYEVSSESGDESDSRETYESDDTSSYASSYDSRDYYSLDDSLYLVDDIDIDDMDSSIAVEEFFKRRKAKTNHSFLGELICGLPSIACLLPGNNEVSLLQESKFNNATAIRQLKMNDTALKTTISRRPLTPDDRPSVQLERKGPIDTDEFSTVFRPQEERPFYGGLQRRSQNFYKNELRPETISEVPDQNKQQVMKTVPKQHDAVDSLVELEPGPYARSTSEARTKDKSETEAKTKTETLIETRTETAIDPRTRTEATIDPRTEAEMDTRTETEARTKGESREADTRGEHKDSDTTIPRALPEKELETEKKRRISAWKSKIQGQHSDESIDMLPPCPERYPSRDVKEGHGGNNKQVLSGQWDGSEVAKKEEQLSLSINLSGNGPVLDNSDGAGANELSQAKFAVDTLGDLRLPESEDILSAALENDEEILSEDHSPQKMISPASSDQEQRDVSVKLNSSPNSITDLTHIEDDQVDNLAELSLPDLKESSQSIPKKITKVHKRKPKKKKKADVEVIDISKVVDQDPWPPTSDARDPSPSQATQHSQRSEISQDPTPSKSAHSELTVEDPSGIKKQMSNPLKTHDSMKFLDQSNSRIEIKKEDTTVEDFASGIWEEEAKKLNQGASTELDFSSAWHTAEVVKEAKSTDFSQMRKSQLESNHTAGEKRSRSKSRDGRPIRLQPEGLSNSNHTNGNKRSTKDETLKDSIDHVAKPSVSSHSRYESPNPERFDKRLPALELRQRAMESSSLRHDSKNQEVSLENSSVTPSKIRDFVQIRSIDQAQSLRQSRDRPFEELASLRSLSLKSYEAKEEIMSTSARAGKSPEPIDVHKYMAESIRSGDRTFAHSREIAENALRKSRSQEPTEKHYLRSPMSHHSPRSPSSPIQALAVPEDRDVFSNPEIINELPITASKSRDSRHSDRIISLPSKSRDMTPETPVEILDDYPIVRKSKSRESGRKNHIRRDDRDSRHSRRSNRSRRSEERDHGDYPEDERSRKSARSRRSEKGDQDEKSSRRRERRLREKEEAITASNELKKLEKRIERQLLEVRKEQKQNGPEWDEQSAVSAKDLRRLEKQLVQRLQKEDEKRAAKLKRIRKRKEPNRGREEVKIVSEKNRPAAETIPPKSTDPRERSKYDQLRVLRTTRPAMRRYLSSGRGSLPAPHSEEILG